MSAPEDSCGAAKASSLSGAVSHPRATPWACTAFRDAQNFGLTALETTWESLNLEAAKVVASVVLKVRDIVEGGSRRNKGAEAA